MIVLFHPNLVARGGSQKYIIDYYKYFQKKHKVFLITYNFSDNCYPEIINEKDVIYVNKINNKYNKKIFKPYFSKILLSFINEIVLTYKLYKKIKDIIPLPKVKNFFQHELQFNFLSNFFKLSEKNLFLYDSKNKLHFFDKGKNLNFVDNLSLKLLFVISKSFYIKNFKNIFVLEEIQKNEIDERYKVNSKVIYGYFNEKVFFKKKNNNIKKKFNLSEDTLILYSLSRFTKYKRIEDIFELVQNLNKDKNLKIFLYAKIMKDDEIYENNLLKNYSNILYPKGNVFIDYETSKSEIELSDLYNSSDIFIFSSSNQTWGNAILESMSCGQVPLISDNCGISVVVNKFQLGEVYEVCNINDMVKRFYNIKNNISSFRNNYLYVNKNFSFEKHIFKIENYINV